MNRALYYIAAIICFAISALSALGAVVYHCENGAIRPLDLLAWIQPAILGIAGWIFMRKHRRELDPNIPYNKEEVISTLGIIAFVCGLVWLAQNVKWVVDVSQMRNSIDLPILERVLAPLVLIGAGIYFGFAFPPTKLTKRFSEDAVKKSP